MRLSVNMHSFKIQTMRLKSFQAQSMTEAMAMVRAALGEEAIIISTREDSSEKIVRVTAAVEDVEIEEPALDFGEDEWEYGDEEPSDALSSFFQEDDRLFDNYKDEDFISDRPDRSITLDHDNILEDQEETYFESAFAIQDIDPEEEAIDFYDWDLEEDDMGGFTEHGFIEPITENLIRHNLPADISDKIISSAIASDMEDTGPALAAALNNIYNFRKLPLEGQSRPIILVGPPGSGKTLCTAKLATRAVMRGLKTAVITTDTVRAGGVEQLKAFTRLLDIDLLTASDPHALEECIRLHKDADQIIIDTPGISPFKPNDMKELADYLKITDFDSIFVMPAGNDALEAADMARAFEILGVKTLLPTKLDISRRYGGILTASYYGHMEIADGSDTAAVADGLEEMNAKRLSTLLIPSLLEANKTK